MKWVTNECRSNVDCMYVASESWIHHQNVLFCSKLVQCRVCSLSSMLRSFLRWRSPFWTMRIIVLLRPQCFWRPTRSRPNTPTTTRTSTSLAILPMTGFCHRGEKQQFIQFLITYCSYSIMTRLKKKKKYYLIFSSPEAYFHVLNLNDTGNWCAHFTFRFIYIPSIALKRDSNECVTSLRPHY